MFVLGHLGIGSRLARPFIPQARPAIPPRPIYRWLLLGCVLPDLIDKPLYYGLVLATGKHGAGLGLFSSTRTIGHSLLFALACAALVRHQRGRALFLGMMTHALLDLAGDGYGKLLYLLHITHTPPIPGPPTIAAVLFPFLGPHFPIMPYHSFIEHVDAQKNAYVIFGELIGAVLLLLDFRHRPRASEQP